MGHLVYLIAVLFPILLVAQASAPPTPTIASRTKGFDRFPGFLPFYWDAKAGKIWLEIDRWDTEFLYLTSLSSGLGSNDVGLDRGKPGDTRIVRFERSGPKVLLVHRNYGFRADTNNPDERAAVEEAFAQSIVWGGKVEADEGGRVLVDATSLFLSDAVDVAGSLRRARQGTYKLDAARSAFYLSRTKNFPRNSEIEATLTFELTGDRPGSFVQDVAPSPEAVTVRAHHSFVALPEDGYEPRVFDPRSGYNRISYMDFAAPIEEPIRKQFIVRHRLKKRDPRAATSEPVEPIVYYLDRGTPEPIRSALLEGARWWDQAFEAAGYRHAFRVELMPEGADPADVRYNVIQWVHRSTRGWSYGSSVVDPRTGEIIKGRVTLGSLRVRQDYLIAEGLLAPYEEGRAANPQMQQLALARLRQLSAHEVGHTLGIMHNYVSSAQDRASVMDYPHPLARLNGPGAPDLSNAYAKGIGEWDKVSIAFGYSDFAPGTDESKALDEILKNAIRRGLYFLSDMDARPASSAHPQTHLWDNGADAVAELDRVLQVRARALERFSANDIRPGAPMATLEEVLVPVYLMHRYQLEAAAKVIGGLDYRYALRGDGQPVAVVVPGIEQHKALRAVLRTISPETLTLPEPILRLIPPRPAGYPRHRELFPSHTGLTFDAIAPAESAAQLAVSLLLNPDRASRLIQYHARDSAVPGLGEIADSLLMATWKAPRKPGLAGEVQRAVDQIALRGLMSLTVSTAASAQARAIANQRLAGLDRWLAAQSNAADADQKAHFEFARQQIRQFRDNPKDFSIPAPVEAPPGMPIGMLDCDWPSPGR